MKKVLFLLFFFSTVSFSTSEAQDLGGGGKCSMVRRGGECTWVKVNLCCWTIIPDGLCFMCFGIPSCTDCYAYGQSIINPAYVSMGDSMTDVHLQWFDDELWVVAEDSKIIQVVDTAAVWNTNLKVWHATVDEGHLVGNTVYNNKGEEMLTISPEATAEERENLVVVPIEPPADMSNLIPYVYPTIKSISLNPNPVIHKSRLNIEFSFDTELKEIVIYDQNGQVVKIVENEVIFVKAKETLSFDIDATSIPAGVYQLIVQTTKEKKILQMIKA